MQNNKKKTLTKYINILIKQKKKRKPINNTQICIRPIFWYSGIVFIQLKSNNNTFAIVYSKKY